MRNRNATSIESCSFQLVKATLGFYRVAHHIWSQELALVRTDLAFGESSQLKNGKRAKTVVYLYFLVVVDAVGVGTAAYNAQSCVLDLVLALSLFLAATEGTELFVINGQMLVRFGPNDVR